MSTHRDVVTLPILPWSGVLFPGTRMSLSVPEPRHRAMIMEASQRDTGFVLSLSRHANGTELSSWSEPQSIGTVARVLSTTDSANRLYVELVGVSRVSLLSFRLVQETLVGQFRFMPDTEETVPGPLIDEAHALGSEIWGLGRALDTHPVIPKMPEMLSYWIAATVRAPIATQQELLEIRSTRGRLAKEIAILRNQMDRIRAEHSG